MNNQENVLPNVGGAPLPKANKPQVDNTPKSQDEIFEMMEAIRENPELGVHKIEGIADDAPPMSRAELEAMIATKRTKPAEENYVEVEYQQLTRDRDYVQATEEKKNVQTYEPGPTDLLSTTIELPSQGYFGGPKKVQIRPMTVREEEILYLSDDNPTYLDDIALSCIVSPKGITLDQLHPNDLLYILYAIRNISFGPEYKQNSICPTCRMNNIITVDITKMPLDYLDASYADLMREVQLRDKKDTVTVNILTEGELLRLDEAVRDGIKRNKIVDANQARRFEFRTRRDAHIMAVNGKEFKDKKSKEQYMESLTSRDYNMITGASSKIRESFGLDRSLEVKCNNCKRTYESEAAIVPEFFRPDYEN